MNVSVQTCFVSGCNSVFPTSLGYYKHMIEHNISITPVYCCEQCCFVLNNDGKFHDRDTVLFNRKLHYMKAALNSKNGKSDNAETMLQKQFILEDPTTSAEENHQKEETQSVSYQCFFMHCYNHYTRRYQFRHHMLHAHGVCLVSKDVCQFCSDVLAQLQHFGKKLKGGAAKRRSAEISGNSSEPKTKKKQKQSEVKNQEEKEKSFEEIISECLEVNIKEEENNEGQKVKK